MRHGRYCIPTTQGQIEVTKGTFLTFNKRNMLKNRQVNVPITVNKLKAIKKSTFGPPRANISKAPMIPTLSLKRISLSSSLRNSQRQHHMEQESTWSNINVAILSMSLSISAANYDYLYGYKL